MAIQFITDSLLETTTAQAKSSSRLRMNHNIHADLNDPVNRMLNALEPGTYLRPHRHLTPPKTEAYIVLRGELEMLVFDEEGNLKQRTTLNPEKGNYGVDIPAGVWHSMIVRESGTVIYEVKEGPFTPLAAEDFAPWSPEADDEEGIKKFFQTFEQRQ